jgi:hypothetical protein
MVAVIAITALIVFVSFVNVNAFIVASMIAVMITDMVASTIACTIALRIDQVDAVLEARSMSMFLFPVISVKGDATSS